MSQTNPTMSRSFVMQLVLLRSDLNTVQYCGALYNIILYK